MAVDSHKTTELTEKTTVSDNDIMPLVDMDATPETKHMKINTLVNEVFTRVLPYTVAL